MRISLVPEGAVKIVWKDVERLLRKSVETVRDKSGTIDILDGLFDGTYVLWVVMDEDDAMVAAFTTRLIGYPQRKALGIDWVGGSRMSEWASDMIETVRRYAREQGCDHLEGYGRKGWTRYLEKYGFYPEYVAYRMELSNGQEQANVNANGLDDPSDTAS